MRVLGTCDNAAMDGGRSVLGRVGRQVFGSRLTAQRVVQCGSLQHVLLAGT